MVLPQWSCLRHTLLIPQEKPYPLWGLDRGWGWGWGKVQGAEGVEGEGPGIVCKIKKIISINEKSYFSIDKLTELWQQHRHVSRTQATAEKHSSYCHNMCRWWGVTRDGVMLHGKDDC